MSDEIKEILELIGNSYYYGNIAEEQKEKYCNYITNLQQRLEASQTNEETYRLEMQDITKCLGLKEDTLFDEVKEFATDLQQENDRLNNIIKNLDKMFEYYFLGNLKYDQDTVNTIYIKYVKLKELKENNNE